MLGLASGMHCVGMCGAINAGFTLARAGQLWRRQLAFNAGRITSYAAAGAAAGALGSAGAYAASVLPSQSLLYLAASAVTVVAGLHFAGALRLAKLDALGAPLWRRVQPLAARLLPASTIPQSYAAGLLWGWLPCGLVYAALAAAVFTGGALEGAAAMAAFGAGTLPWLLAAGVAGARLRQWKALRHAGGALLILLGAVGIGHALRGIAVYCF